MRFVDAKFLVHEQIEGGKKRNVAFLLALICAANCFFCTPRFQYLHINSGTNTLRSPSRGDLDYKGGARSYSRLAFADSEAATMPLRPTFESAAARFQAPTASAHHRRSESPQKSPRDRESLGRSDGEQKANKIFYAIGANLEHKSRSRSPKKSGSNAKMSADLSPQSTIRHSFDYTHSACRSEGCSALIFVEVRQAEECKFEQRKRATFFFFCVLLAQNRMRSDDSKLCEFAGRSVFRLQTATCASKRILPLTFPQQPRGATAARRARHRA